MYEKSNCTHHVTIQKSNPEDSPQIDSLLSVCQKKFIRDPFISELPASDFMGSEEPLRLTKKEILENSICLVAFCEGAIVGVLTITGGSYGQTKHVGTLRIFVDPKWRNQGIGNTLINRSIVWAKNTNTIKRIQVQIPSQSYLVARKFEQFGFVTEGTIREAVILDDNTRGDSRIMALLL